MPGSPGIGSAQVQPTDLFDYRYESLPLPLWNFAIGDVSRPGSS